MRLLALACFLAAAVVAFLVAFAVVAASDGLWGAVAGLVSVGLLFAFLPGPWPPGPRP